MAVAHYIHQLPWNASYLEDERFRKLWMTMVSIVIILGILIPFITVPPPKKNPKPQVIDAIKVRILQQKNQKQLSQAEIERRKREEEERRKKAEEERRKRLEEELKKREEEKKKAEEDRKKAEAERKKREEEERKKLAQDKKRQEEELKKRAEEERRRKEQQAKDQQRKAEEEKRRQAELEKQRQAEEKRRIAEAEQRRKAEAERQRRAEQERVQREKQKGANLATDLFSDIAQSTSTTSSAATSSAPLTQGGDQATPQRQRRNVINSSTSTSNSGGIDNSQLSDLGVGDGQPMQLASRTTTQAQNFNIEFSGGSSNTGGLSSSGAGSDSPRAREIGDVLERARGQINNAYNRARRSNPALEGKFVVKITVLPSGEVQVSLISSELKDAALEGKILTILKGLKFPSVNAGKFTINYTYDFVP